MSVRKLEPKKASNKAFGGPKSEVSVKAFRGAKSEVSVKTFRGAKSEAGISLTQRPNKKSPVQAPSPAERARAALARMTDEEDAAITADALADPDNPPADDLFRRRGRPPAVNPKEAIKLRIDSDVVAFFRGTGDGWQTRMNDALRKAAKL